MPNQTAHPKNSRRHILRPWINASTEYFAKSVADIYASFDEDSLDSEIHSLIANNSNIHNQTCINLNPATNVMNPKAEAVLARGLGTRPSLGYPGDKYEMGLEPIEKIEIIAAELACEIFNADFAEIRISSGSIANLYTFLATTKPGDRIIVPPPTIAGHITHHKPGAAGLIGLEIHHAPIDPDGYTFDIDALRRQVRQHQPKLITIGGSLNLFPHPVREIRDIADEVGAYVLYDAAHMSGMIAGKAWQQPLEEGAHLMTMSTYKSLGGPPSGLILTNDPILAERLDKIAFPGLTANFDVSKSAALALTLLDWRIYGQPYAAMMAQTAQALAQSLINFNIPVFAAKAGATTSQQFAIEAIRFGGGQHISKQLRRANLLACGIGLPLETIPGDNNGLRIGTPEIVRWGMSPDDMPVLAGLLARALLGEDPLTDIAKEVTNFRQRFKHLHFIRP